MQAQELMNENTGTGPGTPPAARNYTIEFWRFVFASLVFYLHYEVYIYMHWASVSGIPGMTRMFEGAYVAVEFFFILSGFLLARSAEKKGLGEANWKTSGQMAFQYLKKKLFAIWPSYLLVLLVLDLLAFLRGASFSDFFSYFLQNEWSISFLGFFGFGPLMIHAVWFIPAMVCSGYIFTALLNRAKYLTLYFVAPITCITVYSYLIVTFGHIDEHTAPAFVLTHGFFRGLAATGLGIITFYVYKRLLAARWTKPRILLLSILELYAIVRVGMLAVNRPHEADSAKVLFYLPILILSSFLCLTPLSRVLNNPLGKVLGKLSLMIYLSHEILILYHDILVVPILKQPHRRLIDLPVVLLIEILLSAVLLLVLALIKRVYRKVKER